MSLVFVSFGSNIRPQENIAAAFRKLTGSFQFISKSSLWLTPPLGRIGPEFLNAVVCIDTDMDLHSLKWGHLREIEADLHRVRSADKYAPRTIDLDILVAGNQVIDADIWNRVHLAVPLAEVLPDLTDPLTHQTITQTAAGLLRQTPITQVDWPEI